MATKYKGVLKTQKEIFNYCYKTVCNPNLTRKENTQNAINDMAKTLANYREGHEKSSELMAVSFSALIEDFNGNLPHYFISDKNFLEFLKTTEIRDTEVIKDYITENKKMVFEKCGSMNIALHTEEEGFVFSYIQNEDKTIVCVFGNNDDTWDFPLTVQPKSPYCKLAINLIYYMKAYPDKVLDGVPEDIVKNDRSKYQNSYHIKVADEIVEKTEVVDGRIVTPHFRSGHFRYLKSDYYKNKKGQVIFIAATMVKGKAKTVVA